MTKKEKRRYLWVRQKTVAKNVCSVIGCDNCPHKKEGEECKAMALIEKILTISTEIEKEESLYETK